MKIASAIVLLLRFSRLPERTIENCGHVNSPLRAQLAIQQRGASLAIRRHAYPQEQRLVPHACS